jgi:hypothetical protein
MKEINLSPYCLLRDPLPGRPGGVLLVFSAANTPEGKFLWSKRLAKAPYKQIYLNCPGNQWYLQGIPGLGVTPAELVVSLKRLIKEHFPKADKIYSAGGSMGGYGALLIGCQLGAESILAFGAELKLGMPGSNSFNHAPDDGGQLLCELRRTSSRIRLVYGETFFPDLILLVDTLEDLSSSRIEITTLEDRPHSIPPYVDKKYGLPRIIDTLFEGGLFPFDPSEVGRILEYPWLVRVGYACQEGMRTKNLDRPAEQLEILLAHEPEIIPDQYRGYAHAFMALLQYKLGDTVSAVESCDIASALNPNNLLVQGISGRVALYCEEFELAFKYSGRAMALQQPEFLNLDMDSYWVFAKSAIKMGKIGQARKVLTACLKLRPNFKKASKLLAQI